MKKATVRLWASRKAVSDQYAIVDAADLDAVTMIRKWYLHTAPRSRTHYVFAHHKGKRIRLHHLVLGAPAPGFEIDHINSNGLDNRKSNLRFVTHSENMKAAHARKPFKARNGKGISRTIKTLSDGTVTVYYYHKKTRTRLPGAPGDSEFEKALERIWK